MSTPLPPKSKQGAARHTGKIRWWEGEIRGGQNVRPHANRAEDWRRRKIDRMKRESRFTEKIGE